MRIKGVIFDMDGLMLDSERLYERAALDMMEEMRVEPSLEVIHRSIGLPEETWAVVVRDHYGADFDMERYKAGCGEIMRIWYEERQIPTKPGLFELLDYLRDHGIARAVASSTYTDKAMRCLSNVGAADYFSAFVFGDMVKLGKPNPEIFRTAADKLGLAPENCMGLEDSFNGVRAAHGAGLYTVMVPDLLTPNEEILTLTDGCLPSLHEIIPLLDRLNA